MLVTYLPLVSVVLFVGGWCLAGIWGIFLAVVFK